MFNARLTLFTLLLSALAFAGCADEEITPRPTPKEQPANSAPVAAIDGPGDVVFGASVTLDASVSTDVDGDELSFYWTEDPANPPNNFLDGLDLTSPSLVFKADALGTFTYTVEVKDTAGETDSASLSFTVEQSVDAPVNYPPAATAMAVAGSDFYYIIEFDGLGDRRPVVFIDNERAVSVELLGTDPEGDDFWTETSGAMVNGIYARSSEAVTMDTDPFADAEAIVWLNDDQGGVPEQYVIDIRVVPSVGLDGLPSAIHVDCEPETAVDTPDGSMVAPFGSIAEAYQVAKAGGISDIYVAAGTCNESVTVGLDGINLYGMFLPEQNWRRRTSPSDRVNDSQVTTGARFVDGGATTIRNPGADALLFTESKDTGTGALLIDGFSFDLDANWYAVSLTLATGYDLTFRNNAFAGAVTHETQGLNRVGGGIRVVVDHSPGAPILIERNLFNVGAAEGESRFQVDIGGPIRNSTSNEAGAVYFYSNVFYGEIGNNVSYSCRLASGERFAFCFWQGKPPTSGAVPQVRTWRNLFLLEGDAPANGLASVVDTFAARHYSVGNVAMATGLSNELRLYHGSYETLQAILPYNRFTEDPFSILLYDSENSRSLRCVSDASPNYFGTAFTLQPSSCSPASSPAYYGLGSSRTSSPTVTGAAPWRQYAGAYPDVMPGDVYESGSFIISSGPLPAWDFDGRYGFSGTGFDVGAFEPGAPMY